MREQTNDKKTAVSFHLDYSAYKELKKIGYYTNASLSEVIREGIALVIKKHKKMLTKSD